MTPQHPGRPRACENNDTSTKARVLGAAAFADMLRRREPLTAIYNNDIFRAAGVSKSRGYAILRDHARTHHDNGTPKQRGRKKLLSDEDLDKIEALFYHEGFEGHEITYAGLCDVAGVDFEGSTRTLRRALVQKDWRRCIACERSYVSPSHAKQRIEYARKMLEERPAKEDYRDIRFSDEWHASVGGSNRVQISRKPGERYCPNCILERPPKDRSKEKYNVHFWAAVGWDFKSDLYEYRIPTNANGKMTSAFYRQHVLNTIVKSWLDIEGPQGFVLEEDRDSCHSPNGTDNICATWKTDHKLRHFSNCPGSPDFSPMENCWKVPNRYVSSQLSMDRSDLVERAKEGWASITQVHINELIDSLPDRFKKCLDSEGKMTGF